MPGYGFVAPDVPELALGVLPGQRGGGRGRAFMEALIRAAGERPASVDRLGLSVEDGNPAVRLHISLGFSRVGRNGRSDTMLLDVRTRPPLGRDYPAGHWSTWRQVRAREAMQRISAGQGLLRFRLSRGAPVGARGRAETT
ncbi:GNAT family N-acetyltransferase [Streptomyces sp. NPDC058545]|uniref:GNAT family N-acetyltransferase n=1 Tax=Streptomyces sp. NPDC058545 TaxID=3346544 RepID=UPI00365CB9E5